MCDYDLIGGGDPIGKIKLGWNQNKDYKPGFKHWKEVLENPRRPIIKWHVLQVGIFILQVWGSGLLHNYAMFDNSTLNQVLDSNFSCHCGVIKYVNSTGLFKEFATFSNSLNSTVLKPQNLHK